MLVFKWVKSVRVNSLRFGFWSCLLLKGTLGYDGKQSMFAGGGCQVLSVFWYFRAVAWKRPSFLVIVSLGADLLLFDVGRVVGALGADTEVGFAVHFAEEVVVVSAL